MRVDTGISADHVLTFDLGNAKSQPKEPQKITAYYRQLLTAIESVPGVFSASAQTGAPLFPSRLTSFAIAGESSADSNSSILPNSGLKAVTPEYFKTFGLRLVRGRTPDERDLPSGVKAAVVNQAFVRTWLHGAEPLGKLIAIPQPALDPASAVPPAEWQIVGVYHDVRSGSMRLQAPEILIPFWQRPSQGPVIAVRTAEDPDLMIKSIAAAVHSVDPAATVARPRTMEQIRTQVLGYDKFTTTLFVTFGVVCPFAGDTGSLWGDVLLRRGTSSRDRSAHSLGSGSRPGNCSDYRRRALDLVRGTGSRPYRCLVCRPRECEAPCSASAQPTPLCCAP